MKPSTIRELVDYLVSIGLATPDTVRGCSADEVDEVRRVLGVALHPEYEEFLHTMGRRAGDLLHGTDFFYPGVIRYFDEVREFVIENDIEGLVQPGSALIGMHQGAELYWMEPSGAVHWYQEGARVVRESWASLLDCLVWNAQFQVRLRARRVGMVREFNAVDEGDE